MTTRIEWAEWRAEWDEKKHPRGPDGKFAGKIKVGDRVTHGKSGKSGTVTEIYGGQYEVKLDNGRPVVWNDGELSDHQPKMKAGFSVGSPVKFKFGGKPMTGKVASIEPGANPDLDQITLESPTLPKGSYKLSRYDWERLGLEGTGDPEPATPKPRAIPPKTPAAKRAEDRVRKLNDVQGARRTATMSEEYADMQDSHRTDQEMWWDGLDDDERANVRKAASELPSQPIRVRASEASLAKILDSGRFKSSHEVNSTGASTELDVDEYNSLRKSYESDLMGASGVPDSERPIYGYVGDSPMVRMYGQITVELHPSVRDRTTATLGDSLSGMMQPYPLGSFDKLTDKQLMSTVSADETNGVGLRGDARLDTYAEAQIHGGVTASDIASITLPADLKGGALASQIAELGIEVRY